jgi:predicted dehydrogenase
MNNFTINRRKFLNTTTAMLALSSLHVNALPLTNQDKPLNVGLIGTGWYGKSDLFRLIQVAHVNVLALCDVDQQLLQHAGQMVSERQRSKKIPKLYGDYKKMLQENKFDIILIGSPDHWHALQAIDAMKAGAHVYVQKPISVDVIEGEAMVAAARKYKRVVQVGTQRRSTPHLVEAKKNVIDAGLLGKISHVEMCCYYHMKNTANPPLEPVPDFLDYERWTGPAPLRPYDGLPHRGKWRGFMEYGNGIVGDMCIHMFDAVRWMLNLGWPKRINSTGGIYVQKGGKSNISDTQHALFEYDELNCIWQHRTWGKAQDPAYPWAFFIYGEKGTLKASVMGYDFIPEGKGEKIHIDVMYEREKYPEDVKEPDIEIHTAPATRAHMVDFLTAIRQKSLPVADIEQGHISTASCIIANLSMQLKRPLAYDPGTRSFKNDPEANKLLKRAYRKPYIHPDLNNI